MTANQVESLPTAEYLGDTEHLRVFVMRANNHIVVTAFAKDDCLPIELLASVIKPAAQDVSPGWLDHVVPSQHEHALELTSLSTKCSGN